MKQKMRWRKSGGGRRSPRPVGHFYGPWVCAKRRGVSTLPQYCYGGRAPVLWRFRHEEINSEDKGVTEF